MKKKEIVAVDLSKLGIDASRCKPVMELTGKEENLFAPLQISNKFDLPDNPEGPVSEGCAGKFINVVPCSGTEYLPPHSIKALPEGKDFFYPIPLGDNAKEDSGKAAIQRGTFYVVYEEGEVIGLTKQGDEFKALNFTIKFLKVILVYEDDDNAETSFFIRVTTSNKNTKDIEVAESQYDRLYDIVKKNMPGAFRNTNGSNACAEYFADCFEMKGELPVEIRTVYSGWQDFDENPRFYKGIHPFYARWIDPYLTDVPLQQQASAIRRGMDFLRIGRHCAAICLMFLFAHIAFLRFWLERQRIRFHSQLYVVGSSGSLKTAVATVIANVLDDSEGHRGSRMTSSHASAKDTLKLMRDTLFLIDDFSNGNKEDSRKSEDLRYSLTRILADDVVETKMDRSRKTGIAFDSFRTVVIFTAEEYMDVGRSTELRTVSVDVDIDTFDEDRLTVFQQDRSLMQNYFSLFIQYLTQAGPVLEQDFQGKYLAYRNEYSGKFPGLRRIADTSAQLRLTVDVINQFATDNGLDILPDAEKMICAIEEVQQNQLQQVKAAEPHRRFVKALFSSLLIGKRDADSGIALSEADYNADSKAFIGYNGNRNNEEVIFIRFDPAWDLVIASYKKAAEPFYQKKQTIKNMLFQKGVIVGIPKTPEGPAQFSFKKSRPPRDSMTIFRMEAVNNIIDEKEELE